MRRWLMTFEITFLGTTATHGAKAITFWSNMKTFGHLMHSNIYSPLITILEEFLIIHSCQMRLLRLFFKVDLNKWETAAVFRILCICIERRMSSRNLRPESACTLKIVTWLWSCLVIVRPSKVGEREDSRWEPGVQYIFVLFKPDIPCQINAFRLGFFGCLITVRCTDPVHNFFLLIQNLK